LIVFSKFTLNDIVVVPSMSSSQSRGEHSLS
jgi:hypothetical protein